MGHGIGHGKLGFDGAGNARFTGSELLCLICKKVKAENQPYIKKKIRENRTSVFDSKVTLRM